MFFEKRASKKAARGFTWAVKFYYVDQFGAKRRYSKSGFATKAQAEAHGRDMLAEIGKTGNTPQKVTLGQVWDEWSELHMASLAPNTQQSALTRWKAISPHLAGLDINRTNYHTLQSVFNELSTKYSKGTCSGIRATLNVLFKHAIRAGYTDKNPVQYVEVKGKEKSAPEDALSLEELEKIVKEVQASRTSESRKRSLITFLYVGYYTGLRISEALALEKGDIDLQAMTISVTKQVDQTGRGITERLKTKSSRAVIPLASPLADYLTPILAGLDDGDLIMSKDGSPLLPPSVGMSLAQFAKRAGINFHPHLLRHTFITNVVRSGADPKTAAQLARHSDISTTLNVYTQMNQADLQAAIQATFESRTQKDPNPDQEGRLLA